MRIPTLFLLLTAGLYAAESWSLPFFTSDPQAVWDAGQKVPSPAGSDVFIVDSQSHFQFDESGRLTTRVQLLVRVVTDAGAKQFSTYGVPWQAWRQEKPTVQARVITPDAKAHPLDPATITEAGLPNQTGILFTDTKVLSMPLPAVTKGALVEFVFGSKDREVVEPDGRLEQSSSGSAAVGHFQTTIEVPASSSVHVSVRGISNVQRKEMVTGATKRIVLEAENIPATLPIALAPPERVGRPAIVFSTAKSWQNVAQWYSGLSEPQIGQAQPVPGDPQTRMKEIEAILAEIQKNVRYTGVELGLAAYRPGTPEETLARGYGDCKDKSALLVNRLRKAGIAANLALLTPYPTDDVLPEVPGMEAFNHAIVYVPGAHPLWIDPTAEFAPARRLPWGDQGRLAMIIDPRTTELIRTPISKIEDETGSDLHVLQLSEEGDPSVTVIREDTGGLEDVMRPYEFQLSQIDAEKRNSAIETSLKPQGVGRVVDVDIGDPRDLSGTARVTIKGQGYNNAGGNEQFAYAYLPQQVTPAVPLSAMLQEVARQNDASASPKRTEDYYLPHAFIQEDHWGVIAPRGFKLKQLPEAPDVPLGPLLLHRYIAVGPDGSPMLVSRLEVTKQRYTIGEAKAIADAWAKLNSRPVLRLNFMPEGAMLMESGKWKEGVDRLLRDTEQDPPRAAPFLRYGTALLNAGLRDEAVAAFRKAAAIDPKSATVYGYLASAYRHDPAGRLDKPGIDLGAAEAAIQKAIELDPAAKKWIAERAVLMEMNPFGERFQDPARLQEAIGLLEGISSDLPKLNRTDLLPEALFMARRFKDARAFYNREEGKLARKDLEIAAIAGEDGSAAAIRESKEIESNEGPRRAALLGAARFLIALGDYSKAAELYEAGASDTDSGAHSGTALLRRARGRDQDRYPKDAVIAVVQRYIATLAERDSDPGYKQFTTREWPELAYGAQRTQLLGILSGYSRLGNQPLGFRATADVVIGNVEFSKDGSDAAGYRVRFADPAANGAKKTIAWVVRRDGGYRILGLRNDQATSGGEALALAKKGDLTGARQWLDWEREEINPSPGADPLASAPFLKLWPPAKGENERDRILAAAASLVARGAHYKDGLDTLSEVRTRAKEEAFQEAIDQSITEGLIRNGRYADATPVWQRLFSSHPSSLAAFNGLRAALTYGGHADDAIKLMQSFKPDSAFTVAADRGLSWAYIWQHRYVEAAQTYRDLCTAGKCEATDWNALAWVTLFDPQGLGPEEGAAETAVRMTQERNISIIHTLATVQAETGKLKEAHDGLVRYLGNGDEIDDSARYLQGRIAEGLGLKDASIDIYSKLPKPKILSGETTYELAQIRLAILRPAH